MEINKIAVLGAGLMGHGICQVAAQTGGYHVTIRDVEQRFLDSGMKMIRMSLEKFESKGQLKSGEAKQIMERIHPTLSLEEAARDADLVIEAVPERIEIKRPTFKEVDECAPRHAIIASNTSSISITQLASMTSRPEKVCGMHFFNPPQLMQLVEVIRGMRTSNETIDAIIDTAHRMKKETVLVKKDSPGFIVNRILIPALNEAVALFWEGVADRDDIDKAIKLHHRPQTDGPSEATRTQNRQGILRVDWRTLVRNEYGTSIHPIFQRERNRNYYLEPSRSVECME